MKRIGICPLSGIAYSKIIGLAIFLVAPFATADQSGTTTQLETIVVESSKEPTTDKPLGIGVSGSTLRDAPGSGGDPLRGLQTLPGLSFSDDESAAPAVRGSRPEDNIFEVDFLPVDYLFHAGGSLSVFNSDLIDSFDIYTAAYGPEYSGVTGGVFDIKLRDPKTDRLHATIDANFLQAGILLEGPVSRTQSFYLAGRRSYLDLIIADQLDEEEEDGVSIVEFPNYSDYQGKFVWKVDPRNTFRASFNGANDALELNIADDSSEIDNDPILAGRLAEQTDYNTQSLIWEQQTRNGYEWKSALSHTNSNAFIVAGGAGAIDLKVDSVQLKSHLTMPLNKKHELKIGADYTQEHADILLDINDPACTEFEADCRLTGADRLFVDESVNIGLSHLFVKDQWYVNEKLILLPGLSWQHDNLTDQSFAEPRFSLEYYARDNLILSAGMGIYHQLPSYDQIDDVLGNPELEYIKSTHSVLGLERIFTDGWSVKSELYYKSFDNLVAGDDTLRYNNSGQGEAYGLDTLIRKELTDKWSGWLALSISKAQREQTETGYKFAFDYDQPFNATLVGNYRASEKWSFSSKLWMHSGAPYTPVSGATEDPDNPGEFIAQYGDVNSKRLPNYHRLDLKAERSFLNTAKRSLSAYAEIINVLGNRNILEYDYNKDYSQRVDVAQLPTLLTLGVKASF